jgi:hypothetical protein
VEYSTGEEVFELWILELQQVLQDASGLLTKQRGGQAMPARREREFHRSASDAMLSGARVIKGREHLPCGRLWIVQDFSKCSHQRTRNSGSVQTLNPYGGWTLPEYLFQQGIETLPVLRPACEFVR